MAFLKVDLEYFMGGQKEKFQYLIVFLQKEKEKKKKRNGILKWLLSHLLSHFKSELRNIHTNLLQKE